MPVTKSTQVQYDVGVDDLLIAMKTVKDTSTTAPEFDTKIWRVPNVKKLAVKGNGKTIEMWASNKLFAKVNQETQHTITLTHIGMPIALMDLLMGVTPEKGISFSKTKAHELPEFALGILAPKSDETMEAIWYPSCTLSAQTQQDYSTQEADFKENDANLEIDANGLRNSSVIYSKFSNARDSIDDMTIDDFTKQVVFDPNQINTIKPGAGGNGGQA